MNTILIITFALACAIAVSAAPATNALAPKAKAAPSRARYALTGELTKITNNIVTITVGKGVSAKGLPMRINDETKVVLETPETEKVPGKEGQTAPKTVEGKQSDLKPGQRVTVQYYAGVASQITVLQPQSAKPKEAGQKDNAPAK